MSDKAERKKRVRTGCLTCRQRRVKCDEGKPSCERCKSANISCSGYQSPRHVALKKRTSSIASLGQFQRLQVAFTPERLDNYFAYPTAETQRPHDRARPVLAHHQYCMRTVSLLFRDEHLYFWRDHLSRVGWDTEYVFDAIVALGLMHRASLLLAKPNDKWRGLDTKVIGFDAYGNTLKQISGQSGSQPRDPEMLIAVLLLLTYFEVFSGDTAAAFRHFKAATHHLTYLHGSTSLQNAEALRAAAREVELCAQIIIPLPEVLLAGSPTLSTTPREQEKPPPATSAHQERQQLIDIICAYDIESLAVWRPLGGAFRAQDVESLTKFQDTLMQWKEATTSTFVDYEDFPSTNIEAADEHWGTLEALPIPPVPLSFATSDAALAVALYNVYMARINMMLCLIQDGDENREYLSYAFIYQNLRIVASVWRDNDQRTLDERIYLPCNCLKIGFIPILYLGSMYAYNMLWQHWTVSQLHSIRQEGLFRGESFAVCLESMSHFQNSSRPIHRQLPNDVQVPSKSPLGSPFHRIIPVLLPDAGDQVSIAYYVQGSIDLEGVLEPPQVIGKAIWGKQDADNPRNLALEFFTPDSYINTARTAKCIYRHILHHEPITTRWEQLLGTQTVTPDAFASAEASSSSLTNADPFSR